jgi:hypothetical protein
MWIGFLVVIGGVLFFLIKQHRDARRAKTLPDRLWLSLLNEAREKQRISQLRN